MYRLIKLISLVILIMMPAAASSAGETLWGNSSDRIQITTLAGLQALFASGTGSAFISNTLTATSTGDVAGTAFDLPVPDDGSRVDIDIEWRNGASMIWNSTGVQPGAGSIRNGVEVDFGNGGQAEGSRVILRNLRYRHYVDGVLAGLTATEHQGVVFVNRIVIGPVNNTVQLFNPDISHRDDGSSSIAGGSNPSGPIIIEIHGGRIHGPIGWDVKHVCDPSDCTGAGSYFYGTTVSSDSEFNTPRCIKGDSDGIAYFAGGTVRSCYFDMRGKSSVYVNGTTFLGMPASQFTPGGSNPNDAVFVMSESTSARGNFFLRGAGADRADIEGLVIINNGFLGSFDLSGTAMDCLGPFWYSPSASSTSGWGVINTSGAAAYGSGRLTLRGPTNAGAVCGPRDSGLVNSELANGVQLGIDVGFRKLYYNTLEGISLGLAAQSGAGASHIAGYRFTITNDTAVGACTDATSDGTLDGGGSATSTCAWNGTAWVSSP